MLERERKAPEQVYIPLDEQKPETDEQAWASGTYDEIFGLLKVNYIHVPGEQRQDESTHRAVMERVLEAAEQRHALKLVGSLASKPEIEAAKEVFGEEAVEVRGQGTSPRAELNYLVAAK